MVSAVAVHSNLDQRHLNQCLKKDLYIYIFFFAEYNYFKYFRNDLKKKQQLKNKKQN